MCSGFGDTVSGCLQDSARGSRFRRGDAGQRTLKFRGQHHEDHDVSLQEASMQEQECPHCSTQNLSRAATVHRDSVYCPPRLQSGRNPSWNDLGALCPRTGNYSTNVGLSGLLIRFSLFSHRYQHPSRNRSAMTKALVCYGACRFCSQSHCNNI